MSKKALITGITGQVGSYLTELLLEKGYEVFGLIRRSSTDNRSRIRHLYNKYPGKFDENHLLYGDITDPLSIIMALKKSEPDEVYNLAAQAHILASLVNPLYTAQTTGLGLLNLLESIRLLNINPRVYHASSVDMLSGDDELQNENTVARPNNAYGAAKVYAHEIARIYRESYGMFISRGILVGHESPRRPRHYAARKITAGAADIHFGRKTELWMGLLDSERDWGYAPDFAHAAYLMLQHDTPDDFVIGTGELHTVREFAEEAFKHVGLDYREYIKLDQQFIRPRETKRFLGDATKARNVLGWAPSVGFKELVKIMMDAELTGQSND